MTIDVISRACSDQFATTETSVMVPATSGIDFGTIPPPAIETVVVPLATSTSGKRSG